MRDEWTTTVQNSSGAATNTGFQPLGSTSSLPAITKDKLGLTTDSRSSQGLTRVGRHYELDRGASLNLAARAMKLKLGTKGLTEAMALKSREVSERRQVSDADGAVNAEPVPWWKTVTPEEG
ncbi:[Pyruvate dehydrogenase (acetyl-transferring)] kinase isozyme 2 [Elasticomyces elasticus]|nr:[Pyruvate dehydrogenase (acetyl-transferring)] kinase isozyme 2 [Elasticomyces elasticus]KAK4964784.1 hypothetical protein LTR42_012728 [Elasticomyces elasticus]